MEQFTIIGLALVCLFTPVVFALLSAGVYVLGVGALTLRGIDRREIHPGKDWTTVADISRRLAEGFAAAVSLVGAFFGLVGFLLPWVSLNLGSAGALLNAAGLQGTLNGIALLLQSFIAGMGLVFARSDFLPVNLIQSARMLGVGLILVSVFTSLILISLLATAAVGVGIISVPLGLLNAKVQRLARLLVFTSLLSLCLACTFFGIVQATIGGVKFGGGGAGTSFTIGVEVGNGFWITVGGLVLALVGAIAANALAPALSRWAVQLAALAPVDNQAISMAKTTGDGASVSDPDANSSSKLKDFFEK